MRAYSTPIVWLLVVACAGDDPSKADAPVPTDPVTTPAPTVSTPQPATTQPVPVPATHFRVKAEGVYDPATEMWHGWTHVVDGAFDPYIALELLDDTSGTMTVVCTVTMTATSEVPQAAWAETELGVWAGFDLPADAAVSSDCDPAVAAQIANIGWGASVGLLDGTTSVGLSESLPAPEWDAISLYVNGGGVRSAALVHATDHPTGFIGTGTSIGYDLTRHGELVIDDTGNYDPIDKNDVLRPGGIRGGFYRMESQILGPATRLVR